MSKEGWEREIKTVIKVSISSIKRSNQLLNVLVFNF